MRYTKLGASGTAVSRFALGTMTFGREATEDESALQLDAFVEWGGNLIDTADVYSSGASEEIIGRWLAQKPASVRDAMVLATKARFPTGSGPNDLGLSRKHLATALDASLRRLGIDRVDLYQVHSYDPLTPLAETMSFLADAVAAGKVNYVGLSNFTGWQMQRAVDLAEFRGLPGPITIQPQYNLLAREVEWEILPAATANGLGILPWSPLGGGWLTGKYSRGQKPSGATRVGENPERGVEALSRRGAQDRTWDTVEVVGDIAATRGITMAQVALAWVAARPGVTSVILGARNIGHLRDNLAAIDVVLAADEMSALDKVSDPDAADYPYGVVGTEQRCRRLEGGR
jgi:aryl-alcohol dehydrogenase-like predicted oxidoreductase